MSGARPARMADLPGLLDLFRASDVSRIAEPRERAERIWRDLLARPGVIVFLVEAEARIVATCTLITVPNLLRDGHGHAFLENVVTHPDHRGQGHGRAVVRAALDAAWAAECHHVLLQSGRADPRVHRFYEGCSFVAGLRTAYAARRPG